MFIERSSTGRNLHCEKRRVMLADISSDIMSKDGIKRKCNSSVRHEKLEWIGKKGGDQN